MKTCEPYKCGLIIAETTFSNVCAIFLPATRSNLLGLHPVSPGFRTRASEAAKRPAADALFCRPSYRFPYGARCQAFSSLWGPHFGGSSLNVFNGCLVRMTRYLLRRVDSVAAGYSGCRSPDFEGDDPVLKRGGRAGAIELRVLVMSSDRVVVQGNLRATLTMVPKGGRTGDFRFSLLSSSEYRVLFFNQGAQASRS